MFVLCLSFVLPQTPRPRYSGTKSSPLASDQAENSVQTLSSRPFGHKRTRAYLHQGLNYNYCVNVFCIKPLCQQQRHSQTVNKTQTRRTRLLSRCTRAWNQLPTELKTTTNTATFKREQLTKDISVLSSPVSMSAKSLIYSINRSGPSTYAETRNFITSGKSHLCVGLLGVRRCSDAW